MVDRVVGQLSLADGLAKSNETIFDEIARAIDWVPIAALLGQRSGPGSGNTSYPAEPLLRCLLLGTWHGLSDPALEAQVRDRLSFRRFAGFSLSDDTPDHSTLWRFREELTRDGLIDRLLEEINRHGLPRSAVCLDGPGLAQEPIRRAVGKCKLPPGPKPGSALEHCAVPGGRTGNRHGS